VGEKVDALSMCRPKASAPALATSCDEGCSEGPAPSLPSRGENPAEERALLSCSAMATVPMLCRRGQTLGRT
jgi:hypothetical protein